MKKLLLILFVYLLISCTSIGINNADISTDTIPLDPAVEYGILDNGLKYFIRSNGEPQNRIVLRLIINAGSILEDEDQLGLAHLVEHMAFNGTVNYKKHEIIDYLESTGMRFGADINAHTGFDETVYKINIPADDPDMLKNGLSILKEWAFEIAFEEEEIDKERGVVVEEWRSGRGAEARMRDKYFPVLFSDSRYASRLPIGDMDIVKNSSYDTIKRFYKDWYRPELMAVMVVGEVDTISVIKQIEDLFEPHKNDSNPRVRKEFSVPDNSASLYSIVSDPEATVTNLQIFYKNDSDFESTKESYKTYISKILHDIMFGQRLDELTNRSDPPYIYAFSGTSELVRTKSAFSMGAVTAENGVLEALETLLEENERFIRFGFTESEFDRAKRELTSYMEYAYREKDKTDSASLIEELTSFFLDGTPAPGIEWEWKEVKSILSGLTLDEVINTGRSLRTGSKPVVIITGPEKDSVSYPEELILESIFKRISEQNMEAYKDSIEGLDLMTSFPVSGSIVNESHDKAANFNIWELSNGSRVVFKSTDFKNDELLFSAFSPGGTSLIEDSGYLSSTLASNLVQLSGLGDFDVTELGKVLAGKRVVVNPYIGSLYEGFSGGSVPKDVEILFQLINLYFTDVRRDGIAFDSFMNRLEGLIENRESRPEVIFQDELRAALYNSHFRSMPLTVSRFDEIEKSEAYDIFQERFSNPSDFTFFFVGNIPKKFRSFVETYIASIPGDDVEEIWIDRNMSIARGINLIEVHEGIEEKSSVRIIFSGSYDWTLENNTALYALRDLLNIRLREEIREESSGTYGVGVSASLSKFPVEEYTFSISFSCDPVRVKELTNLVFVVIDEVKKSLADSGNIVKIKEGFRRTYEKSLRENSYWLALMDAVFRYGLESSYLLDKPARNDAVSADMIRDAAVEYLDTDNYFKAVLYPEE